MKDNGWDLVQRTIAFDILAVRHEGGLLERYIVPRGVKPGMIIMVPADCWCVLVAGDQATSVFDVGQHELMLPQFNRRPSGFLVCVGRDPQEISWYPAGTPYRRILEVQAVNPVQLVQQVFVERGAETATAARDVLRERVDQTIPPGSALSSAEGCRLELNVLLAPLGLKVLAFTQELATGSRETSPATPGIHAPEASRKEQAPAPAGRPLCLVLDQVWASSRMLLLGRSQLELRISVQATSDSLPGAEPYVVEDTYRSAAGYLKRRVWLPLPEGAFRLSPLPAGRPLTVHVEAAAGRPGRLRSLGRLTVRIEHPVPGEVELGPTEGGERRRHLRLRGRLE